MPGHRSLARARLAGAVVAFLIAGFLPLRHAQALVVEDKETFACLIDRNAEKMQYPEGLAALKVGGVIRVRLTFSNPVEAPQAEIFYESVGEPFRSLVLDRISGYRMPCLSGSDAAVATQEFQFIPGDGRKVVPTALRDDGQRKSLASCLKGAEEVPWYSREAMNAGEQGRLLVRLTFADEVSAPEVKMIYDGGNRRLARLVTEYVSHYRLPCLKPADVPLVGYQPFDFMIEGSTKTLLRDVTLATFVRTIDRLDRHRVRFDFNTMGCPFDVRLTLWRPVGPNWIDELERADPNRREFLEWLSTVELALPHGTRPGLLGDTMNISIPCGVLDLL